MAVPFNFEDEQFFGIFFLSRFPFDPLIIFFRFERSFRLLFLISFFFVSNYLGCRKFRREMILLQDKQKGKRAFRDCERVSPPIERGESASLFWFLCEKCLLPPSCRNSTFRRVVMKGGLLGWILCAAREWGIEMEWVGRQGFLLSFEWKLKGVILHFRSVDRLSLYWCCMH